MNDSIIETLLTVLDLWNQKMVDIWNMVSMSPVDFRDGAIWAVILDVYGVMQATGLALLVLFFVMGVVKTCGSFTEVKRPEQAFKCKGDIKTLIVVVIAAILSCIIYFIPVFNNFFGTLAISVSAVLSALIGAIAFPRKEGIEDGC